MIKKSLKILYILFLSTSLFGQSILINEVSSSNIEVIEDEDGDYSDWLEIYNNSSTEIDLSNYYLSDDVNNLKLWQFSNVILSPDSLILVFASGKDRTETIQHWETIVREGDECKYTIPTANSTDIWKTIEYDDSAWLTAQTGIGYGDSDDNTTIPASRTVYLRCNFFVENPELVNGLYLHVDFDDGFVAYLNGTEIARENMGEFGSPVYFNSFSNEQHEAQMYQGLPPDSYNLANEIELLQNGENVLSVEVHNFNDNSSDLTIIPFLSLGYNKEPINSRGGLGLPNLVKSYLHTNFKLDSSGENLIISNLAGEVVDSLYSRKQISDVSLGRFPNGSQNFYFFQSPTPGYLNIDNGFIDFLKPPEFSVERGYFQTAFFLDMENPNSLGQIRYTSDGSEPLKNSTLYTDQIIIPTDVTVVKAKVFYEDLIPSQTTTHTYLVGETQNLPTISLSTNPENFFDYNTGIYVHGPNAESSFPYFGANFWEDWERPIHIEFFEEENEFGFEVDCGVKIFGGWSRGNAQRSLAFYARGKYGYSEFNYKLFPDSEIEEYQSFVLRNSGNDWNESHFRDGLMGAIVSPLNIDKQNYRPVVVYLNGEYWGIYNLREKVNEHFIESHHGTNADELNILENHGEVVYGENGSYFEFYNSLLNANMSHEQAFSYIESHIDVEEFIDYYVSQIFFDNRDWPGNNIKFWKERNSGSKWRWILFDTDFGFGIWDPSDYKINTLEFALQTNGPEWPNPPWSTFLLRKFLENEKFKNLFIARYSIYSNTIFNPENMINLITEFSQRIKLEIPTHFNKWGASYTKWLSEIENMKSFALNRKDYMTLHTMSEFNISGQHRLSLDQNIEHGSTIIEGFEINDSLWIGDFFNEIQLLVEARPNLGYKFSHWEGDINSPDRILTIKRSDNIALSPVFIPNSEFQIVINEINYNSSDVFNTEDWIELYNFSEDSIDLSGWKFKDEDKTHQFLFSENSIISSRDYLILCRDTVLFKVHFPGVPNYIGNLDFGLDGNGEFIQLVNANEVIIDSLTYDDESPWPMECDGNGPTLELINHELDNSLSLNWSASEDFGTPGRENSTITIVENTADLFPEKYYLKQNYPNPFNPSTVISYQISEPSFVTIKVFDILGRLIQILVNGKQNIGYYSITFYASNFSSGIYIYQMKAGEFISSKKMLLLQ